MYYRVSFETVIRGHHVYKQSWKPENKRAEAKEYDTNAIGVYVTHERPDAENTLARHVPIELSRLLTFFLQANADRISLLQQLQRKREVGLVVPAKFTAFTQELKNAKILKRELNERAFELKNITIDEN